MNWSVTFTLEKHLVDIPTFNTNYSMSHYLNKNKYYHANQLNCLNELCKVLNIFNFC